VAEILIVDDDEQMCQIMSDIMKRLGHQPSYALTLKEGLRKALCGSYDVIFLDVRMPDGNGLEVLPQIREAPSSPEVVIITGYGSGKAAELAMRNEAWDYIEKPASIKTLGLIVSKAIQYREQKKARIRPSELIDFRSEGMVGSSTQMEVCLDLAMQIADTDASVLITGETGTGKELLAHAIHRHSRRASRELVVLDCAALPEMLAESIIFGHRKGAFTGADRDSQGIVEQAHGGTLFFDEIGELPLGVQSIFLRVLQERRFRPVGSTEEKFSDFRLLAATNRNLPEMVQSGQFRADLLFRLQIVTIRIPPLRERPQDTRELARYRIAELCAAYGKPPKDLDSDFIDTLAAYDWPGNVRELFNVLERAFIAAQNEPVIFPRHLPTDLRVRTAQRMTNMESGPDAELPVGAAAAYPCYLDFRRRVLDDAIRRYMTDLLTIAKGNLKEASRISGLSLSRLYELLKKYDLQRRY